MTSSGGSIPLDQLPLSDGVVCLRLFVPADAGVVAAACRDPDIPRWTFMPDGLTEDQARAWIEAGEEWRAQGRNLRLAVVDARSEVFLGQVGVGELDWQQHVGEIYYWLAPEARGRGVATRAVCLLSEWAFLTLGVERLVLYTHTDNSSSQAVASRAGFQREGLLRSHQTFKGRRVDSVAFARLPTDP